MGDVLVAALLWRDARSKMVNMAMNDKAWKATLNDLSEMEDLLSRAVDNYRKQKESEK